MVEKINDEELHFVRNIEPCSLGHDEIHRIYRARKWLNIRDFFRSHRYTELVGER